MVVPVPPVEEQHRIVAGIKTLFTVLEEIQTGLDNSYICTCYDTVSKQDASHPSGCFGETAYS